MAVVVIDFGNTVPSAMEVDYPLLHSLANISVIDPRCACAARVTVLAVCVCVSVCLLLFSRYRYQTGS